MILLKRNRKGFGVYADKDYEKEEVICVLHGKKKTPRTLYYHENNFRNAQINPLQIGEETYLELDKPYKYFNHSCDPNAGIREISTLFALKNIKEGEEITFDYSTTIDESFICQCGSNKCRRTVVDFFGLPQTLQKYYITKGAVPKFIVRKYKKSYSK